MGYKRAGFRVLAANDIDPRMAANYQRNLHPPHYFLGPISDVTAKAKAGELPSELYELDVLDGSPPCSTFSFVGSREKAWGVKKKFREGQAEQVLSDLFFDYLDIVEALRPKISVAENVKGMLAGNAKGYVRLVVQRYRELGYDVQVFLVNAADCGVAQTRERVFFVARRKDLGLPPAIIAPSSPWVTMREALADVEPPGDDEQVELSPLMRRYWDVTPEGERLVEAYKAATGKDGWYSWRRLAWDRPACTLVASSETFLHPDEPRRLGGREFARLGGFPDDYEATSMSELKYMVGMSVPPPMLEVVAQAVRCQLGV